jgi:hypothetical protein
MQIFDEVRFGEHLVCVALQRKPGAKRWSSRFIGAAVGLFEK